MKKNYIAPVTKVTKVALQQIMVTSPTLGTSDVQGNVVSDAKNQLDIDVDDVLQDWDFEW